MSLNDWGVPRAGVYRFETRYLGRPIGRVEFVVTGSTLGFGKRPAGVRRTGIRWEWGHIVNDYRSEQNGLISLAGVMESLTMPPGLDFIVLGGGFLVIMVSAGVDDGPDHRVQVVVQDEAGQELGSPVEGQLHCGSAVPGYPFHCPFELSLNNLELKPGTYFFRVSVDGKYVDSVVLPVVASS